MAKQHDDIAAAFGRADFQVGDFPVQEFALDRGLSRQMKLEGDIPTVIRPRGKQVDAVIHALDQHGLQGDMGDAGVVKVGSPIVVGAPEAFEANLRLIAVLAIAVEIIGGNIGTAEAGRLNGILPLATGIRKGAMRVGVAGEF